MIALPYRGWTSNQSGRSKITFRTGAHVIDAGGCRGENDLDQLRRRPAGCVVASSGSGDGYDHALGREVRQVATDVVENRLVVLADVMDHPRLAQTPRRVPPRSSFEISSPVDSFDDGRPGREDGALLAHDAESRTPAPPNAAMPGRRAQHGRDGSAPGQSIAPVRVGSVGERP